MKLGIDISAYQGNVDFDKVKKAGIEFVIIRAGWGQGNIDAKFKRNIELCNQKNIPCGVYWFSYAYTVEMAKREAKAVLKAVAPYRLEYPIWFDFEYDSVSYAVKKGVHITKQLASDIARAFMQTIKAAGYSTGNYTNLDFSRRMFDDDVMTNYDKWAARYTSQMVDVVNGSALWQYSSSGKVSGIYGNVDCDYALKDYPVKNGCSGTNVPIQTANSSYKIPAAYSVVFDPDYYLNKYADLQTAVTEWIKQGVIQNTKEAIEWQLFQHFYAFGMNECRLGNATFDVKKYRAAYSDLDAVYRDEWKSYYFHYLECGAKEIAEGRRAKF